MKKLDKYRGCLIGGAAGDALGYPVEFLDADTIFRRYGSRGITEYALTGNVAQISDDTQMTLFTAAGLLLASASGCAKDAGAYPVCIARCYKDWLRTQKYTYPLKAGIPHYSWLLNLPALYSRRAPGNTCLSAIESFRYGCYGSIANPINNSKGCGGIMRVAPIGLYFNLNPDMIDEIGAEAAALTHGHELGYLPAAVLVHIIHRLARNDDITVLQAVLDARAATARRYADAQHLPELLHLLDLAVFLAQEDTDDLAAIRQLGEGWVAEETLAIAVYCAVKYHGDFDRALIVSVNHSGDSDSTGALTGNILGAHLGLHGIPPKYLEHLELRDAILELADDLFRDGAVGERDEIWESKYVAHTYVPQTRL